MKQGRPEPRQEVGARRERALATRRRILRAAYVMFRERGYAGTTMESLAKAAGVAVQTLYFTFHTKAALLEEVEGASVVGFDAWAPPAGGMAAGVDVGNRSVLRAYHDWFGAFEEEASARRALEIFLDSGVEIMERTAPLVAAIRQAATDPDARHVYEAGEKRRAEAFRIVVQDLSKKQGGLREGLTVRRATDVLLTVFSGETYQTLRDRGWKPREVRAWLLDVLCQQLLAR